MQRNIDLVEGGVGTKVGEIIYTTYMASINFFAIPDDILYTFTEWDADYKRSQEHDQAGHGPPRIKMASLPIKA